MIKQQKRFLNTTALYLLSLCFISCASETINGQSKGLSVGNGVDSVSSSYNKGVTLFPKEIGSVKKALIVGVSDYAGENNDLGGIEKDVSKMKTLFEKWGFDVVVLYDKNSFQILDYLNQYMKTLDSDDYFAFYYSGHGSHVPDKNGDEEDGEDETLVLSNGQQNKHLLDDIIYGVFNNIKAKKMIFFDSCHSGTVFRKINLKAQPKTISPERVTEVFNKGTISTKTDKMDSKSDYIVFSSSQDNEESLATPTGSLFTNSICEIFLNENGENKSFVDIDKRLTDKILNYAEQSGGKPHHPNISFSKSYSSSNTIKDFIRTKSPTKYVSSNEDKDMTLQNMLDRLIESDKMEKMSLSYDKSIYKTGESVEFSIDTKGVSGYLTIFYVDSKDITILYPNSYVNSRKIEGKYLFPKDLSGGKFELEAYKNCKGCGEEKTVIYTLLSSQPVTNIKEIQSKGGLVTFSKNSNKSKIVTRAVRIKGTSSDDANFKPQLGKYVFIVR